MVCGTVPLSKLGPGEIAGVEKIVHAGKTQQRLCDLGMIPGAEIRCLYSAPSGSPTAYEVLGAVVALRRRDAESVLVKPWG